MRVSKKLKGLLGRQAYCPSTSANSLDVQTAEDELAILENRFMSSISNTPTARCKRPLPTTLSPTNLAWLDLMQKPAKSPCPQEAQDGLNHLASYPSSEGNDVNTPGHTLPLPNKKKPRSALASGICGVSANGQWQAKTNYLL
jgi:hypothetical protein